MMIIEKMWCGVHYEPIQVYVTKIEEKQHSIIKGYKNKGILYHERINPWRSIKY